MEKKENARNKIIVLYILSKIPGITVGELTAMSIDTCYMNYFEFATALDDLIQGRLITISTRKNETITDADLKPVKRCDMTATGTELLNRLKHLIPDHIHTFLNKAFLDWDKNVKRNSEVSATYEPDFFGGYNAELLLTDGNKDLVKIKISLPSKEMAITVCNSWKNDTQTQYLSLLSMLSGQI